MLTIEDAKELAARAFLADQVFGGPSPVSRNYNVICEDLAIRTITIDRDGKVTEFKD